MKPATIESIVTCLVAALVFAAGWAVEGWRLGAEIALIQKGHADARAKAANENTVRLAAANKRGDDLVIQLAGWENTLVAFAQEKTREIDRLTTGRRCLDSAAVGVLNRTNGLKQSRPVSETASEPLRGDATFATDTDVGSWIAGAQRAYDTCRGRLQAIADFYDENRETGE